MTARYRRQPEFDLGRCLQENFKSSAAKAGNKVDMATADGSHLFDLGKVHLKVEVDHKNYEHLSVVAKVTNEAILGTDFLRMHGGKIDFVENRFLQDGQLMRTCNG